MSKVKEVLTSTYSLMPCRGQDFVTTDCFVEDVLGRRARKLPSVLIVRLDCFGVASDLDFHIPFPVMQQEDRQQALWSVSETSAPASVGAKKTVSKWGVMKQLAGNAAVQSDRPWQMTPLGQHISRNFLLYEHINESYFAGCAVFFCTVCCLHLLSL